MGSNISKRAGRPLALIEATPIVAEASMRWIIRGDSMPACKSGRQAARGANAGCLTLPQCRDRVGRRGSRSQLPCDRASFHNRTAQGAEP
jgi:hypothetical protein